MVKSKKEGCVPCEFSMDWPAPAPLQTVAGSRSRCSAVQSTAFVVWPPQQGACPRVFMSTSHVSSAEKRETASPSPALAWEGGSEEQGPGDGRSALRPAPGLLCRQRPHQAVTWRQSPQNCRAGEGAAGEMLGALTRSVCLLCWRRDWSDWEERPVSAVCLFCEKQAETTEQLCAHMEVRRTLRLISSRPAPRRRPHHGLARLSPSFPELLPLRSGACGKREAGHSSCPRPWAHAGGRGGTAPRCGLAAPRGKDLEKRAETPGCASLLCKEARSEQL